VVSPGTTGGRRQDDGRATRAVEGVLHRTDARDGGVARELLGGNGIQLDYNVARFFADAEALYSYEGTYQMQNPDRGKASRVSALRVTRRLTHSAMQTNGIEGQV